MEHMPCIMKFPSSVSSLQSQLWGKSLLLYNWKLMVEQKGPVMEHLVDMLKALGPIIGIIGIFT